MLVVCGSGGTGRRARLRGVWISPYGFKSRFPHKRPAFAGLFIVSDSEPIILSLPNGETVRK